MEEVVQQSDVVQEQSAPESAPAVETPQTGDTPAQEVPAYTPNYKFKSYDQEYEFDDDIKPLVTNKQLEDKFRDLFTAARGIEGVRKAKEKTQSEYQEYKKSVSPVMDLVNKANKAYQEKDYNSFFKTIGLSDQEVLQYAYKQLEYMEMPQDKRAQIDETNRLRSDYSKVREESELLKAEFQEIQKQKALSDLDQALSSQEVSNLVSAFDQRNGAGAFKQEVINRGFAIFQATGQNLTPAQVVQDLMSKYSFAFNQGQPQAAQAPQTPNVAQRKEVPVMQVPKGASTSVAAKQIKTLDDLHAVRKEKYGY